MAKALPGAELVEVVVNDHRPIFALRNLLDLNLPAGTSTVRTTFTWQDVPDEVCPWSLYEGKKMSLPARTELTVVGLNTTKHYTFRFRMFGLPDELWQGFKPILTVTPLPVQQARSGLTESLVFANTDTVRIAFKPVYFHHVGEEEATFPVLVCFRTLDGTR